jgi:hypothetical protein
MLQDFQDEILPHGEHDQSSRRSWASWACVCTFGWTVLFKSPKKIKKLQGVPRRAADEEDVALSAFDSFCRAAEDR